MSFRHREYPPNLGRMVAGRKGGSNSEEGCSRHKEVVDE